MGRPHAGLIAYCRRRPWRLVGESYQDACGEGPEIASCGDAISCPGDGDGDGDGDGRVDGPGRCCSSIIVGG